MTGTSIKYDLKGIDEIIGRLKGLDGVAAPFLKAVARRLKMSTQERFITETDPEGNAWKKSNKTSGKTLTLGGLLRASIASFSDETKAVVGTNRIYAGIHQHGGQIIPKNADALRFKINGKFVTVKSVTMPKRSFLGVSEGDKEAIKNTLNAYLNKGLKI